MKITLDEWKQALVEAQTPPPVPKGWITIGQFRTVIGKGPSQAAVDMKLLLDHGKAEPKKFLVQTSAGARSILHYRLKK